MRGTDVRDPRAFFDQRDLFVRRRLHLDHHVGLIGCSPIHRARPFLLIARVGVEGCLAGPGLDDHVEALFGKPANDFGHKRHPALARCRLFNNSDCHKMTVSF